MEVRKFSLSNKCKGNLKSPKTQTTIHHCEISERQQQKMTLTAPAGAELTLKGTGGPGLLHRDVEREQSLQNSKGNRLHLWPAGVLPE